VGEYGSMCGNLCLRDIMSSVQKNIFVIVMVRIGGAFFLLFRNVSRGVNTGALSLLISHLLKTCLQSNNSKTPQKK
jgi:hypothetical protein